MRTRPAPARRAWPPGRPTVDRALGRPRRPTRRRRPPRRPPTARTPWLRRRGSSARSPTAWSTTTSTTSTTTASPPTSCSALTPSGGQRPPSRHATRWPQHVDDYTAPTRHQRTSTPARSPRRSCWPRWPAPTPRLRRRRPGRAARGDRGATRPDRRPDRGQVDPRSRRRLRQHHRPGLRRAGARRRRPRKADAARGFLLEQQCSEGYFRLNFAKDAKRGPDLRRATRRQSATPTPTAVAAAGPPLPTTERRSPRRRDAGWPG